MSERKRKEIEFIQRVNESQGIIHKVCRMYCDDQTHREDLFQEIVLQLVAIQDFRKEKKRKYLFLESFEFKEPITVPHNGYQDERIKTLYQAIAKLDKIEKAIMMLHLMD